MPVGSFREDGPENLLVGQVVGGRFHVERVIGKGGMGWVVAARDARSGERVAVKMIRPELAGREEFVARLRREAKVGSALQSPHVVRVFETGTLPDGAPYMVMELLEGMGLDQLLRLRGALPIPEAIGYLVEVCDAMAEAHVGGVVHRDLKPSNFFLADRPEQSPIMKVLDFGIVKQTRLPDGQDPPTETQTLTATDTALGSPHYMAPEQLRNSKGVDLRADIWSLGLILHRMVAGRLAFEADSAGAYFAMICTEPPTPLRQHRKDAPAELEAIVLRCLRRDPLSRFQNVGQLALALAPLAPASVGPIIDRVVATIGPEARTLPPDSDLIETMKLPPPPAAPSAGELEAATVKLSQGATPPGVRVEETRTSAPWSTQVPSPRRGVYAGAGAALLLGGLAAWGVMGRLGAVPIQASPERAAQAVSAPGVVPAPSVARAEVTLHVDVQPPDATLELDGAPARDNPLRLPRDGAVHKLVARATGYLDEEREVRAAADAAVAIALRPVPRAASAGHDGGDPHTPGPAGSAGRRRASPPSATKPAAPPVDTAAPKRPKKGLMETDL